MTHVFVFLGSAVVGIAFLAIAEFVRGKPQYVAQGVGGAIIAIGVLVALVLAPPETMTFF